MKSRYLVWVAFWVGPVAFGCGPEHSLSGGGDLDGAISGDDAGLDCPDAESPSEQPAALDDPCTENHGGCDPLSTCSVRLPELEVVCGPCPAGYAGTGSSGCKDVDECATDNGGCGPSPCTNTQGSFVCGACPAGYAMSVSQGCVNIDECDDQQVCPANQICTDNEGGFDCTCKPGFAPAGEDCKAFTEIDTSESHSCGITTAGAAWCWGMPASALGIGKYGYDRVEGSQLVVGEHHWANISAGASHTCAIRVDGTLWCWGAQAQYILGLEDDEVKGSVPFQVGTESDWKHVESSFERSCAIKTDDSLWCWGQDVMGSVGVGGPTTGSYVFGLTQVAPGTHWKLMSLNWYGTCAVKDDDSLWCWGGWVSPDAPPDTAGGGPWDVPHLIDDTGVWTDVSVGSNHVCGIKDGDPYCWGANDEKQVWYGEVSAYLGMTRRFQSGVHAYAGSDHSCFMAADGYLKCWGDNSYGQFGVDTIANPQVPAQPYAQVDVGWRTMCGIRLDGAIWCWGTEGVAGDGFRVPVAVVFPKSP